VSSHALDQQRIEGLEFAAAIFTNLTRDHLDYHGTMEAYFESKSRLVAHLGPKGASVWNADDPAWHALPGAPRQVRFGVTSADAEVRAEDVSFHPRGSRWTLVRGARRATVELPFIGDFNVANALGAAAGALALGFDLPTVAARLSVLPQVPGRLEILSEHPTVLRDYAHTPDALERALMAMRPFTPGRLIVVFGCGGDRDKGKRPMMAAVAHRLADAIVVTSDNPRTEDPEQILDEICAALPTGSYERIEDRRTAIATALAAADPVRDVVLLAGKGHETYQIRGTTSYPFDEAEIVRTLLDAG
jgi:UDP-N-acetylmuramoyl-L-alanyl-D-glutamate--2,6-diaminopimelate ligase